MLSSKNSETRASYSERKAASFDGSFALKNSTNLTIGPAVCSIVFRKCCKLSAGTSILARSKVICFTPPPRRSLTMLGSPHSGGGATPGGGGGAYRPTRATVRPINNSGGQVANAIVSPAFSTRSISPIATSGRGANMWPNWLTTTSKLESSKGRLSHLLHASSPQLLQCL